jgi:accessory gene regulator B
MLQAIAEEISLRLVANRIIGIDKKNFYTYGIELLIINFLIFLSIAIIGILTNKIVISLIYAFTYCPIRNYAGGYHCKTYSRCYITTLTLYLFMLFLDTVLTANKCAVSYTLISIAVPMIAIFTPVDYGNGPIEAADKKKYRIKSIILLAIAVAVFITVSLFHQRDFSFAISWGVFVVFLLMLVSLFSNFMKSRRRENGKKSDAQISRSFGRKCDQKGE